MNKDKEIRLAQAAIRQSGRNRFAGIHRFRESFTDRFFFSGFKTLFPLRNSLQDYHGQPFPKTAGQLFANKAPRARVIPYREILWSVARCLMFTKELSEFLVIRRQFELAFLTNDYSQAISALKEVEQKFGKSIWWYQNSIAAAYITGAEVELGEIADKIEYEVKDNAVLKALLHYIRKRIEGATLREKLKSDLAPHSNYFQAKILNIIDSSNEAVSSLLFFDAQASVIDHYDSLVFALQSAISDNKLTDEMTSVLAPAIRQLQRETNDQRLDGVLVAFGLNQIAPFSQFEKLRAHAIEEYTEGNYPNCVSITQQILSQCPDDSPIRLLNVKARVAIGDGPIKPNDLCSEIDSNLFNLFGVTDDFFRSIHALLVLADRFYDHTWMLYLRVAVLHEIGAEEAQRMQPWMRDTYVRDHHVTPFTALTLRDHLAKPLLQNSILAQEYPKTLKVVNEALCEEETIIETLAPRVARYRACSMLGRGNYKEATKLYLHAAGNEVRLGVKLRVLGGASLSMMLDGKHLQAVDTLVEAYLENQRAPILLPFRRLVELLPDMIEWPNTIRLGILLNLANVFDEAGDLSLQRLAFEKFCLDNGIRSPAELLEKKEEFGVDAIIEYLDRVWRPEVMRQTLLYCNADQIEEARIDACRILTKIDSSRARVYQEELASRIKQQEISKATQLVEQSKVYVDIEAIKRSLRTRLGTSYSQYKSSLMQHDKPHDEVVRLFATALSEGDASLTSLSTLLSKVHLLDNKETHAELQFNALFSEIAKEFLTGDHGLNAFLSTRVRHGKFVDAMRKAVMDEHLVTSKTSAGNYAENTYWIERLGNSPVQADILSSLEQFATEFDKTLGFVRDKLIQIHQIIDLKTTDNNSEGLFLYHFSILERRLMQSYDFDFKDLDELIAKCVDILWEKTDGNLETVRSYLNANIRSTLISHFDNLSERLSSLCGDQVPSLLANAIARARTASQHALENVIAWFKRNEVYDRQDFDVDFPAQIAASMVHRTMSTPTDWSGPQYDAIDMDAKLPGRSLDSLVDVFYALFENAVKYAESNGIELDVHLRMSLQNGDYWCEIVSVGLPPSTSQLDKLQQIRESLATQESRRLAQSEGKSGFRKIWIALDNPLFKSPELNFDHEPSGNFRVIIKFRTIGPA